jgi:hypothetical protein
MANIRQKLFSKYITKNIQEIAKKLSPAPPERRGGVELLENFSLYFSQKFFTV